MTNERQHPDFAAESDEAVSATYRELSREGAPNHLNDKVLQQAARHALRPRYSRSIMWTRPLAWAATVGLCLAIVLEVTRVPTPEIVMTEDANDFLEAEPPASLVTEEAQAPVHQRPEALKDMKSQLGRSAAKQAANEPKREVYIRETASKAEEIPTTVEDGVASGMIQFEMHDADMPQRSDAVSALAVSASSIDGEATNECPDEIRVDPVTWLACIVDLEERGDIETALRQREALKEAFPQFIMP